MELTRRLARVLPLALGAAGIAAHAGDYVLEIDGKRVELDLDRPARVDLGDGKSARVLLHQEKEQTWREQGLSFKHPATFAPARHEINKNVTQTLMATPSGSMVIVQHYTGLDPHSMVETIANELTDEEVRAGYTRNYRAAERRLGDGTLLRGKLVHTEHASSGERWDREVVATGDEDGGFLVVSGESNSSAPGDHAVLELFWRSLHVFNPALDTIE